MEKKYKEQIKKNLYRLIFDIKTPSGRFFDIILISMVVLSTAAVMLESVEEIKEKIGPQLVFIEWFFTIIFTVEYVFRIKSAPKKKKYIFSFFGLIDLVAILPTYASLFFTGIGSPLIIRSVRLIRIFRSFKLVRFLNEGESLLEALKASWHKILVFLLTSTTFAVIAGTLMFLIEGKENGFNSIPHSVYWAIVTLTTVGYGDISPHTPLGQTIASIVMILGYGIIAVPTGLVAAEMVYAKRRNTEKSCVKCRRKRHEEDATFCKYCGGTLKRVEEKNKGLVEEK